MRDNLIISRRVIYTNCLQIIINQELVKEVTVSADSMMMNYRNHKPSQLLSIKLNDKTNKYKTRKIFRSSFMISIQLLTKASAAVYTQLRLLED